MTDRIDLHTHVFNVRYLPLAGILTSRGVPRIIAKGIAALLNHTTGDRIGVQAAAAAAAALDVREAPPLAADEVADPAAAIAAKAPPEMLFDEDVSAAMMALRPAGDVAVAAAAAADVSFAAAPAQFRLLLSQVESRVKSLGDSDIFKSGLEYLEWFRFLTHSEQALTDALLQTYGADVKIFVHHMMDLQHYYDPGDCFYDFVTEQIVRMRKLVDANEGRLLTFVAWSPKRPNDAAIVKKALADGNAVGVKVYPPSGYQPDEAFNDPIYDIAGSNIPLFAHCTPVGFEAHKGFGNKSDPAFWRNVLEKRPSLRLCLAHAGGDEPWFGKKAFSGSFAERAFQLARDFPNVYCEFGYHDDVLHPERRQAFVQNLARCLEQTGGAFGKKIIYGTDWHLIEKIPGHEEYFRAFEALFDQPPLSNFKEDFFFNNAVTYMNLPHFLERRASALPPESVDPVRAHLEDVMALANG
jgi:predicted TIM-barrel fold metal-dependent hydrolase